MILSWMIYSLVIGALIGIAALLLARAASLIHLPARFVWFAAITLGAIWPLAVLVIQPEPVAGALPAATVVPFGTVLQSIAQTAARSVGSAWIARMDVVVLALWGIISAILIGRLASDSIKMRKLKESWTPTLVDGHDVRVAPDCGPAVVGATHMEIVIPEWALSFDSKMRGLILRHEDEHRIAHDPLLVQVGRTIAALLPWHIALHWQLRHMRHAVEVDCDARVLRAHPDADRYAKLLLAIAHLRSASRARPALALAENTSNLEGRILAMQNLFAPRRLAASVPAILAAMLVIVAACAVRQPVREEPAAPVPASVPAAAPAREVAVVRPAVGEAPFFSYEVSRMARILSSATPLYPPSLRQARKQGEVLVQFVIDTNGRAEMTTFKVIKSDDSLFTAEVRAVVPQMLFAPAEISARKVRMYVQLPFEFKLDGG